MPNVERGGPSPEEAAGIQKERTISDAAFLKDGAVYVPTETGEMRLEITSGQLEQLSRDFSKNEFWSEVSGLSPEKTDSMLQESQSKSREFQKRSYAYDNERSLKGYPYKALEQNYAETYHELYRYVLQPLREKKTFEVSSETASKVHDFVTTADADRNNLPKLIDELVVAGPQQNALREQAQRYQKKLEKWRKPDCCIPDDIGRRATSHDASEATPQRINNGFLAYGLEAARRVLQKPENIPTSGQWTGEVAYVENVREIAGAVAQNTGTSTGETFKALLNELRK